MIKLEKMYKELDKAFGHYVWIDDYSTPEGQVEIQVADCMACECEDIIDNYGYPIIDEGEFCGSEFDGVTFLIKVA